MHILGKIKEYIFEGGEIKKPEEMAITNTHTRKLVGGGINVAATDGRTSTFQGAKATHFVGG